MTKNEMAVAITKKAGLEQQKVKQIVQFTLDGIIDVLSSEKRIELRNFGVFEVRTRKARRARNPRTGAEVMVPSRQVVSFKAGKIMEELVEGSAGLPQPVSQSANVNTVSA